MLGDLAGQAVVSRKLYSRKDTLLGTISYPAHWDLTLKKQRWVRFYAYDPKARWYSPELSSETVHARVGVLERMYADHDGVYLHEISLEEFERIPGCSFSPSAAYLRSLME